MSKQSFWTRRQALGSVGALPLASAVGIASASAAIDLSNPAESHKAHVKLRGSLVDEWVFRHYWGDVYAVLPERLPVPMFKFQGLIKAKWTNNGDGTHSELLYDMSSFLDWKTESILGVFDNPISGEKNDVIQVWDGPSPTKYTIAGPVYPWTSKPPTAPVSLPWRIEDGHVWLTESALFERPHPLDPKEWPKASSGKTTLSMVNVTLSGRLADLEDSTQSAPHDMRWSATRSWLPWLHLGQIPGQLLTIGTGRKISGPQALPQKMLEIIDRQQPNYLTSDRPWTEALSSWDRYKKLRKP
jgi:hypothetical protein